MSFYIIGLSGLKRSGKDTVADMIMNHCRHLNPIKIGFADALKDELCKMYGITREYLDAHKENFRLIMQGHGTDYRRKLYGDDYWITKLGNRLIELSPTVGLVVIPDVRFLNEYKYIQDLDCEVWRVSRDVSGHKDLHASETELTDVEFDACIDNNLTIDNLNKCVRNTLVIRGLIKHKERND